MGYLATFTKTFYVVKRLVFGILIVSVIAIFFLWQILHMAFMIIKFALSIVIFIFCVYVIYVFWGALVQIFRGRK